MKNTLPFFRHFFTAIGVVWLLCGTSILLFELNFKEKEILMTLLFPLAYAILRAIETSTKKEQAM